MDALCIDRGNTATKLGFVQNGVIDRVERFANADDDELLSALRSVAPPVPVILAQVGPGSDALDRWMADRSEAVTLSASTPLPIRLDYDTPATLGADRLALVMGARARFPGHDVLAVDAGTALTIDLLTADGTYRGGSIHPGIDLRFRALHDHTASLPRLQRLDDERPDLVGRSTEASIRAGVLTAVLHEVDGFVTEHAHQRPGLRVVMTGGDAAFFERHLKSTIFVSPHLALVGLHEILSHPNV